MKRFIVALALLVGTLVSAQTATAKECGLKGDCFSYEAGVDCKYTACKERKEREKAERKAAQKRLKAQEHDNEIKEEQRRDKAVLEAPVRRDKAQARLRTAIKEASFVLISTPGGDHYNTNFLRDLVLKAEGCFEAKKGDKRPVLVLQARMESRNKCYYSYITAAWQEHKESPFLVGYGFECYGKNRSNWDWSRTDAQLRSEALRKAYENLDGSALACATQE